MDSNMSKKPLASMKVEAQTVRELYAVLTKLMERHADTRISTADMQSGLCSIQVLNLWDTSEDVVRGEWDAELTIVLGWGTANPETSGSEMFWS